MTGRALVQSYLGSGLRVVIWPPTADWKGPREPDWINKTYTIADYVDGYRVGIMHGVEVPGKGVIIDVDLDWAAGIELAAPFLPRTQFIWGRTSNRMLKK